jgi:hypothetical protein
MRTGVYTGPLAGISSGKLLLFSPLLGLDLPLGPVWMHVAVSQIFREADTVNLERFEVFTAVTKKNVVFWDVTPCGSCKNRRFIGT